jgi:DNA-binding transcriptional ArsR family regulator
MDPASEARRAATDAEARALASSLRLRILRMTLDGSLTNQQIAQRLGRSPGSVLHHVRTLVDTGFLAAEQGRRGARGAVEIPYRATGKSWQVELPRDDAATHRVMVEAFLDESSAADPASTDIVRLGLRLDDEGRRELTARLQAVFEDFVERGPAPDGRPWSIFLVVRPDPDRD